MSLVAGRHLRLSAWIAGAVLTAAALRGVAAAPGERDPVQLFPDPARVAADYPDDVERYIALHLLFQAFQEATAGKHVSGAHAKLSAYQRAAGEVQQVYERGGRSSAAFRQFDERSGRLFRDPAFRKTLLARYGLAGSSASASASGAGTAAPARPSAVLFPPAGDVPSDAAIKAAFLSSGVVWAAAVVGMIAFASLLTRASGCALASPGAARAIAAAGPALPESLRVVSVPGRTYEIAVESGQVERKETSSETRVSTTTTQGEVHVQGDYVSTTPARTHTSVTTVQKDVLWVRRLDAREAPWTLWGGGFQVREGHVVSRVLRPEPGGDVCPLLAYNHNTDQLQPLPGADDAHGVRFFLPWVAVTLLGSVPGAFGLGMMFHRLGGLPQSTLAIQLLSLWIMGLIASAIVAAFVALRAGRRTFRKRSESFAGHTVELRRFLAASTPELTARLAAGRRPSG